MLGRRFAIAVVFVALCAPVAEAGPIHYTITFAGGPILPASGSFDYDAAAPQFTDFVVDWDGWTFDLTGSANSPFISEDDAADPWFQGTTGAAASFLLLSGCSSSPCNGWTVYWAASRDTSQPGGRFEFMAFGPESQIINVWDQWSQDVIWGTPDSANGSWSIDAQGVPDPGSTLLLFGIGLVGLGAWRRRWQ